MARFLFSAPHVPKNHKKVCHTKMSLTNQIDKDEHQEYQININIFTTKYIFILYLLNIGEQLVIVRLVGTHLNS